METETFSGEDYFKALFDAVASPVFVVDGELIIHDANLAGKNLKNGCSEMVLKKLCGEVLHCIHDSVSHEGCGTTPHCPDCVLRQTAEVVCGKKTVLKNLSEMTLVRAEQEAKVWFQITGAPLRHAGKNFAIVTFEDVTELVCLRNLLPICMHCRKVRDDKDYWHQVEEYLGLYTKVQFTHGICPDCLESHYPKYFGGDKDRDT